MECKIETHILQRQLEEYAARGLYPLHMPGHKRRMQPAPGLPYSWDVTEVPGTDDLHDARGILQEAMDRTARLCGADRTWYLVNGSTCGLLAGIRALARYGAEVICARNCHKAVLHAIGLSGYRVHWVIPETDPGWGICRGIAVGEIETALRRHPSARAVILTSPTYEGVISDIEGICRICHARGIPVLVDEAHGAHLIPASETAGFPRGAVASGADLVVQSPHKTLPSLTQTALLHLCGDLIDPARIEEELDIFETSSPSYPLLASLDGCTGILREYGAELFEKWAERLVRFQHTVGAGLKRIRILGCTEPAVSGDSPIDGKEGISEEQSPAGAVSSFKGILDPGKILIDAGGAGMTGTGLAAILREKYCLETEMSQGTLLLAMTSISDEEDALDRLAEALLKEDEDAAGQYETPKVSHGRDHKKLRSSFLTPPRPKVFCTIAQAAEQEKEEVPIDRTSGRICAEYLYYYPPGIPFLAPGEIITGKLLRWIKESCREGAIPYRYSGTIRCLRE